MIITTWSVDRTSKNQISNTEYFDTFEELSEDIKKWPDWKINYIEKVTIEDFNICWRCGRLTEGKISILCTEHRQYDYDKHANDEWLAISGDIHLNNTDGTYHFRDETENYMGPYETEESARDGMKRYCEECL